MAWCVMGETYVPHTVYYIENRNIFKILRSFKTTYCFATSKIFGNKSGIVSKIRHFLQSWSDESAESLFNKCDFKFLFDYLRTKVKRLSGSHEPGLNYGYLTSAIGLCHGARILNLAEMISNSVCEFLILATAFPTAGFFHMVFRL